MIETLRLLQEILHRVFIPPFGMVKITFTNTCLMAVMILASRPLLYSDFVDHVMSKFVQSILTVPALVHHTRTISPQVKHHSKETTRSLLSNQPTNCLQFYAVFLYIWKRTIIESRHRLLESPSLPVGCLVRKCWLIYRYFKSQRK